MVVNEKLFEQIEEVKYLAQENTMRYRLIMRFFYSKYEETEYWLYKEDVYNELKEIINNYTMEECERDLEFLFNNKSLTKLQDTQNINTLNDFKYHNFRYQMTDNAIIIERMTIELEEVEVKVASLEPRLFERINKLLEQLVNLKELDENKIYGLWIDINSDFKSLNQQYQDFLKKFYEAKTEELLQSEAFLQFKSSMINYINDFISSYIKSSTEIKNNLTKIDDEKVEYLMDTLISHQKKAPKISPEFDYDKLRKVNYGKWQSLKKWFIGINGISEGERLLEATEKVIEKIYKYASSLMELHGNMINRKEEYKHICKLFDRTKNISESHALSQSIFGIQTVKHFKAIPNVITDELIKSYSIPPIEILIEATEKKYKIKTESSKIIDKTLEKEKILKKVDEEEKIRKDKIKKLIKTGKINLTGEVYLDEIERRYTLKLIDNYHDKKIKESEFGYLYMVKNIDDSECKIISPDGILTLKGKEIIIEVGDIDG